MTATSTALDDRLAKAPLIRTLGGPERNWWWNKGPARSRVDDIPKEIFAQTLVALSAGDKDPSLAKLKALTSGTVVGDVVSTVTDGVQNELNAAANALEMWFDGYMKRLSDLYRVAARKILFLAGFAVAIVLNVNSITLIGELRDNAEARASLTSSIDLCGPNDTPDACSSTVLTKLKDSDRAVSLPVVGDYTNPKTTLADAHGPGGVLLVLLGWLVTGLAVSFGAPFWFDVARRLSGLIKQST